jgi:hypothetical protein
MKVRRTAEGPAVRRRAITPSQPAEGSQILQLPLPARTESAPESRQLSQVLFETAGLLAESLDSGDPRFKDEVIDLAVRSLRVAGTVIERRLESQPEQRHTV